MPRRGLTWRALAARCAPLLLVPGAVLAQALTITGKVTAKVTGAPLMGANVTIETLQISVGSNAQGVYTITVPAARVAGQSAILRVRSIGYTPQAQTITLSAGTRTIDFALAEDINRLNQVVVTGVTSGTEQKKLPFTVAQVSQADMPVPGTNVLNSLQGKIPGAQIVPSSGRPGSTPSIILRAPQSINASAAGRSQAPLLIVDGVVQQGSLQDINPEDIDNIEVVKGAAAATLYGSRAGNGVIQITTKSGKNGGDGVRFSTRVEAGASDIEGRYKHALANFLVMDPSHTRFCVARGSNHQAQREVQDCLQTVDVYDEALRVNEQSDIVTLPPVNFLGDGAITLTPPKINLRGLFQVNRWPVTYDPVSATVTNGPFTSTNVDMTGKFARANFFSSIGDYRQRGSVVFVDGYHRNNVRLNVDNAFGSNWTTAVRSYYSAQRTFTGGADFFNITRQPAYVDLLRRDKYGRLLYRSVVTNQGLSNPAYSWQQANALTESDRFLGSAQVRWQPLSWVDGTFDFGYDRSNSQSRGMTRRGFRTTSPTSTTPLGSISRSDGYGQSYNVSLNWTARRDLRDDLRARLTVRSTFEEQDNTSDNQSGSNLAVPGVTTTTAAIQNQAISSSESTQRAFGFLASVNLEYRERYIFESSVRRDGLSVFGASHRWQTYGRGSFAWRVSEERWWPAANAVNDFKLRYSVGQAGNRPGNTSQYETFSIGTGGVLTPNTLGNRNLAPEVSTEVEFGFDAEILHKYGLTISKSRNITKDQVLLVRPPVASGFSNQWQNAGTLEGNTWEASLNLPIIERRDLSWSTRLSFDRVRSKVTALNVPPFFYNCEATCHIEVGEEFGSIWGRQMAKFCTDLPTAYQSRCGDGKEWQKNDDGLIVWVGVGNTWKDGVTKNLWQAVLPAAESPWNVENNWGMPMVIRDETSSSATKPVKLAVNGHALPDFRWSMGHTVTWRKLTGYVLFDAVRGKSVWNEERAWSYGDFAHRDEDQTGKGVDRAKPIGYYWRVGAPEQTGVGGLYDILGSNNITVEDGSYVKVREVSVGYRLGKLYGIGDWTVTLVGRNLKTWTGYSGYDPEVGVGGGNNDSAVLNSADAFAFPNLRLFTLKLGSNF